MSRINSLVPKVMDILVEVARERRLTTYREVGQRAGAHWRTVIPRVLDRIRQMCLDSGWPPLTALVVNKQTGRPGDDIPRPVATP